MAIGIDPDSPHVQVLWQSLVDPMSSSEWTEVSTVGALAILYALHATGKLAGLTEQQIAEECWWFSNAEFFVTMLIGAGWLVRKDEGFSLGPSWSAAKIKE